MGIKVDKMNIYDFSGFSNVELIGVKREDFSNEELELLYEQVKYCQAMTEADTDTMHELVSEELTFTHMSGRQQSRDEYFADIKNERLRYFTIGIKHPIINVDGNSGSVTYTALLRANAYGAEGSYRISGTYWYEKHNGVWILVNITD